MVARLYRSSDVGAPALGTTTDGSLITILRACLVDGYGSRTPSGWTMPFSDLPNALAAFRTVSGEFLRVDDNQDFRWAFCRGYANMTDLNTGTEEYPRSETAPNWRQWKRASVATIYNQWFVVADEEWFYFVASHDATSPTSPSGFFFGEIENANDSFTNGYVLTGSNNSSTSVSNARIGLFSTNQHFIRRNYLDALLPTPVSLLYNESVTIEQPNPANGRLEFQDVSIYDQSSQRVRYGKLPNHFGLLGASNSGFRGGEVFEIGTTPDITRYVMAAYANFAFAIRYDEHDG